MDKRLTLLLFFIAAVTASSLAAQERGTLQGRFVFEGKPPEVKRVKIPFETRLCGEIVDDESLLVHAKTRGIANIVVQLYLKQAEKPPVHPQLADLRKAPRELKMSSCRFEPHVLAMLTRQKLALRNEDPVGHTPKLSVLANTPWSDVSPGGSVILKQFLSEERLPVELGCSIHPWMRGYVVITDHPYVAISDAQGKFSIPELPPGKWTFRVWHEQSGFVEKVKQDRKETRWFKGRLTVDIRRGKNDLGEILIAAEEFSEK